MQVRESYTVGMQMKPGFLAAFAAAALMLCGGARTASARRDENVRSAKKRRAIAPTPAPQEKGGREKESAGREKPNRSESRSERARETSPAPQHAAIVREKAISAGIDRQQRVEIEPRRNYWHHTGAIRYSHYYDGRMHWYGFYHGPRFYWTRYYGRRWWWRDEHYGRWVYWSDGYWWWPGPAGAVYVYVDGEYSPYAGAPVPVAVPAPPAAAARDTAKASPDGKRLVDITADGQAFLYDKTEAGAPKFMKYLGNAAQGVRFAGGAGDEPLRVMLELKGGGFALFDASGNRVEVAKASASDVPPETPDEIPPPPESAPGD
jgi:hypothetical protein